MFSSGVFWMGLVFIPITSLVFDVAYKVWVSSPLSSLIIAPIHIRYRKFLQNLSYLVKKIPALSFCGDFRGSLFFPFCEYSMGNVVVDVTSTHSRFKVSRAICKARSFISWCLQSSLNLSVVYFNVRLWRFYHVKASVFLILFNLQGEEGLLQDSGGRGAGAWGFIQRPRSSGAWKEVQLHSTTLCVFDFTFYIYWPSASSLSGPKTN